MGYSWARSILFLTKVFDFEKKLALKLKLKLKKEYERLRPLSYPDTNVILLCYSIDNPDSLSNIAELWHPEIRYYCANTPIILVGMCLI